MKKILIILFFFLFFTSPAFSLSFHNITENISPYYNHSFVYFFASYWNVSGNESIKTCNFSLIRDGDIVNKSANFSDSSCNITFHQYELGPAGNYSYYWNASNGTAWVPSPPRDFTIEKGIPILHLDINSSTWILRYPNSTNVTAWEMNEGDYDCNYIFYRNNLSIENFSDITLLGKGNYTYIYNVSECQNYSSNSTEKNLTILPGQLSISLYLNGSKENKTFILGSIANFTAVLENGINVANKTIYIYSNYSNLNISGESPLSFSPIILDQTGIFNLTAYWFSDNPNYTDSNVTKYFEVTPYILWTNSTPSNLTYDSGRKYFFEVKLKGNITEAKFETNFTTRNETLLNFSVNESNNIFSINFTNLAAGYYFYRWYFKDNESNSIILNQTYFISKAPVNLSWEAPTTFSFPTGSNVIVKCSSTPPINLSLYINELTKMLYSLALGSVFTNISSSVPTTYHIFCSPADSNYSGEILPIALSFVGKTQQTQEAPPPLGKFSIVAQPSITINLGENLTTSFILNNTYDFSIQNISILIEGIPSSWYKISKGFINKLNAKSLIEINITFNIPENAEPKTYNLNLKAISKTKNATRTISLIVNPLSEIEEVSEVEEELNETTAETNVTEMPTGYSIREYNPSVAILGILSSALIFIFRKKITRTLMMRRKRKYIISELLKIKKRIFRKT